MSLPEVDAYHASDPIRDGLGPYVDHAEAAIVALEAALEAAEADLAVVRRELGGLGCKANARALAHDARIHGEMLERVQNVIDRAGGDMAARQHPATWVRQLVEGRDRLRALVSASACAPDPPKPKTDALAKRVTDLERDMARVYALWPVLKEMP